MAEKLSYQLDQMDLDDNDDNSSCYTEKISRPETNTDTESENSGASSSSGDTAASKYTYKTESELPDEPHDAIINSDESDSESSDDEKSQAGTESSTSRNTTSGIRKKRAHRPKWLREIRYYQSTTHFLLPKKTFRRLVREIGQDFQTDLRFTENALEAIQTAAEDYLIKLFSNTMEESIKSNSHTIHVADMKMVNKFSR